MVDESYLPFVEAPEQTSLLADRPSNVVVLHSMSKIFRIPGLRIGFAVGPAGVIERLQDRALPWNVNSLALEALHYLLSEGEATAMERFVREARTRLAEERIAMMARLEGIRGIRLVASTTGFFFSSSCRNPADRKRFAGSWPGRRSWCGTAPTSRDCPIDLSGSPCKTAATQPEMRRYTGEDFDPLTPIPSPHDHRFHSK